MKAIQNSFSESLITLAGLPSLPGGSLSFNAAMTVCKEIMDL